MIRVVKFSPCERVPLTGLLGGGSLASLAKSYWRIVLPFVRTAATDSLCFNWFRIFTMNA